MGKVYLNVALNVIVDCDSDLSADDIMEHLNFTPTEKDEVVEVLSSEVDYFEKQ